MNINTLCSLIDERKNELFELLSELIKINSESFGERGNEEECARYVYELCQKLGLESDMFSPMDIENFDKHPDYMPGRNLENRYNTVARYLGAENEDELLLMAHIDTVRIGDVNEWKSAPLSGEIRDGKIFGRGAGDDKYAVAAALFVMKLLKEQGFVPKKNLVFAAYCDEEYGGSHGALSTVIKYPAKRIVSMDGRYNQIWHCGSGGGELKYFFHTKTPADSAKTAAKALSVVIDKLEETFANNRRAELEANRFYKGATIPKESVRYMGVRAGNSGSDLGKGEVHFVFYTDRTKEEIDAELKELEAILQEVLAPLGIIGDGFEPATRFFHYVFCEPDGEDIRLMVEASEEAIGKKPMVCSSCLSDLSVISKYGSSRAYGFGCGRDFSEEGGPHQPNEYIECDKFVEFTKVIATYILKVLE
ncbi:MAG: M20 family metallopeptidase [Oscillospiraceae bacterium]|nr:M20 family metallopeptidase [Oscillospiraceae bacterium]